MTGFHSKQDMATGKQESVECLDCGSHNIGVPATYDSLVDSVKAQPVQEPPLEMKFWKIEIDWIGVKADADIKSAEGRAWFVTQAKGLWRKLPNGKLKRQILIETAELVQIRQNDLATLWGYPEPNFRRN
jgi:hypothetical protein